MMQIARIQNDDRMRQLRSKAAEADAMVKDGLANTLPALSGPVMKRLTQVIAEIQNKIQLPQEARINIDTTAGVPSAETVRALAYIDAIAKDYGVDLEIRSQPTEAEMALVIARLQDLSNNEGFVSYMLEEEEEEPEVESETPSMEEPDMEAMFRSRA